MVKKKQFWLKIRTFALCGFVSFVYTPAMSMEIEVTDTSIKSDLEAINKIINFMKSKNLAEEEYPSISKIKKLLIDENIIPINKKKIDDQIEEAWEKYIPHDEEKMFDNKVPSHYLHRDVKKQITMYRRAFDQAMAQYDNNVQAIKEKPIPGLFDILRNGFSLVNDFVKRTSPRNLSILWDQAIRDKNSITIYKFQSYIDSLARIVDVYKGSIPSGSTAVSDIVFIIYGNPDPKIQQRGILPSHFVDEVCQEKYSAYLAFFDILSSKKYEREKEKNPENYGATKRDPHWSIENGTSQMLWHDLNHIKAQTDESNQKNVMNYIKSICKIQKEYKDKKLNNESKILSNGLFIMKHELSINLKTDTSNYNGDNINEVTKKIISFFKDTIMNFGYFDPYGSKNYKQENRDWEYILKGVHDKTGDFLPLIPYDYDAQTNKELKRPFPFAFNPKDPNKLIIVTPELLKENPEYMFNKENNTPELIYLKKDEQKKIPPHFSQEEANRVKEDRKREMSKTLQKGYARFWNYFLELVEGR